ncbi:hypothetical protein [Streptomyces avermitilis]|uniref:hypothetical protein n=1 Tax=Streptomyces avermitilis TaxID=33903 RepID=UPI00381812AF
MIATTPVARWTWGRDHPEQDNVVACLHELLVAYEVLNAHELMIGTPEVSVAVHEAGKPNSYLFQGTVELDATAPPGEVARQMAARIAAAAHPGEVGSVYADAKSDGIVMRAGEAIREEGLFRLGASALLDYVSVELVTYSDVWMPYDLEGRAQPSVFAENGSRLSAALRDLSEALDTETDPDDPTYFGKPSETGVENYFEEDGSASDVWSRFEIPYRYQEFTHAPGFGRIGYKRTATGEVQYMPVHAEQTLLGHIWASDVENAASFEPVDVGDEEAYKAGLLWLERLRAAHDRGLAPSAALDELSRLPDENGTGKVDTTTEQRRASLADLRERTP